MIADKSNLGISKPTKENTGWGDKLKPSAKNKYLISKLNDEKSLTEINLTSNSVKKIDYSNFSFTNEKNNDSTLMNQRWDECIRESKDICLSNHLNQYTIFQDQNKGKLDEFSGLGVSPYNIQNLIDEHSEYGALPNRSLDIKNNMNNSFISNLEIKEFLDDDRDRINPEENMFLKREFHSILPFLMTNQKEVHRLTISDFEIKRVYKEFYKKLKLDRCESSDYYRVGLIEFYSGKYITALEFFMHAVETSKQTKTNNSYKIGLMKWLVFAGTVVVFAFLNAGTDCVNKSYNGSFKIKIKESIILFTKIKLETEKSKNVKTSNLPTQSDSQEFGFLKLCCGGGRSKTLPNDTILNKLKDNQKSKLTLNTIDLDYQLNYHDLILNPETNICYLDILPLSKWFYSRSIDREFSSLSVDKYNDSFSFSASVPEYDAIKNIMKKMKAESKFEEVDGLSLTLLAEIIIYNLNEIVSNPPTILSKNDDLKNNILEAWYIVGYLALFNSYHSKTAPYFYSYSIIKHLSKYSTIDSSVQNSSSSSATSQKTGCWLTDISICFKKIKEFNSMLAYLIYCDINYIKKEILGLSSYNNELSSKFINSNLEISESESKASITPKFDEANILRSIIQKYPNEIEPYLKYYHILTDKNHQDYDLAKAYKLSETFRKAMINYDDQLIYLYVVVIHAKISAKMGNYQYAVNFLQKEIPSKFYFPSLLYFFGKLAIKSCINSIVNVAQSSLLSVLNLLNDDLKQSAHFWIGLGYFNSLQYESCYEYWSKITRNSCFNLSANCCFRIKDFFLKYEKTMTYLGDLISKNKIMKEVAFSKVVNLAMPIEAIKNIVIKTESDLCQKEQPNIFPFNFKNEDSKKTSLKLMVILKKIESVEPNLVTNRAFYYSMIKANIALYADFNFDLNIKILTNVIKEDPFYFPSHFLLSKTLKYMYVLSYKYNSMISSCDPNNHCKIAEINLSLAIFTYQTSTLCLHKDQKESRKSSLITGESKCADSFINNKNESKISHTYRMDHSNIEDFLRIIINLAKAFCLLDKPSKSLSILISLLEIFGIYFIENELNYLGQFYKGKRRMFNDFYIDLDSILKSYSKCNVSLLIESVLLSTENSSSKRKNTFDFNPAMTSDPSKRLSESIVRKNTENKAHKLGARLINWYLTQENNSKDDISLMINQDYFIEQTSHQQSKDMKEDISGTLNNQNKRNDLNIYPRKSNEISSETAFSNLLSNLDSIKTPKIKAKKRDQSKQINYYSIDISVVLESSVITEYDFGESDFNLISSLPEFLKLQSKRLGLSFLSNSKLDKTESSFIYILTNPIVLYNIGKICGRYKIKLDLGLICLKEFIILFKASQNYNLNEAALLQKLKSDFWIGIIYIHMLQYNLAHESFKKIEKYKLLFEGRVKEKFKSKFGLINDFNALYQYVSKNCQAMDEPINEFVKRHKSMIFNLKLEDLKFM